MGASITFFVIIILILVIYIWCFCIVILKQGEQKQFLRTFYNAICSIYAEVNNNSTVDSTLADEFEQLNLNYEKLCLEKPNNNYTSILDLLETIIYYYDSYADASFKGIFWQKKDPAVRKFMMGVCQYIKKINPFISIPKKEADLMQSVTDALENNNKSLGLNSLRQLSQEIMAKEKTIVKQKKDNQMAIAISIVGIVLTIFFGFLSLFPMFN